MLESFKMHDSRNLLRKKGTPRKTKLQPTMAEDGSLLQEALKHNNNDSNRSTLLVDVYLLSNEEDEKFSLAHHLQALAETCGDLNRSLQGRTYPWFQGGDGPVFGIHVSSLPVGTKTVPHLRAQCRYGSSVADEWTMIEFLLDYTQATTAATRPFSLVVECTDVEDGQILLIQAAEYLPSWVDHIGSALCQHRCWIMDGQVHLIEPEARSLPRDQTQTLLLHLDQALTLIKEQSKLVQPNWAITDCIHRTVAAKTTNQCHLHKAAIAVPRPLKHVLERRPDLLAVLVQAFANHCHDTLPKSKMDLSCSEEWVWMTHEFGRTGYAMLRSIVATPAWKTEFSIPPRYQAPQVKRLQRQCQNQTTPHLRHGLVLGVRLVASVDALLRVQQDQQTKKKDPNTRNNNTPQEITPDQRMNQLWPAIAQLCQRGRGAKKESVGEQLQTAWREGPNKADLDLSPFLKCPIYALEVEDAVTPLSNPGLSVVDQIQQELRRSTAAADDSDAGNFLSSPPPSAQDVDGDDWMTLPTPDEMEEQVRLDPSFKQKVSDVKEATGPDLGKDFRNMLDSVQTFMANRSSYEGVSNLAQNQTTVEQSDKDWSINPRIFLNLLHRTLQANTGQEVEDMLLQSNPTQVGGDEYFSSQDYDMVTDDNDDDSENAKDTDKATVEMMHAMDQELEGKQNMGRTQDTFGIESGTDDEGVDIHLLSNLLKSLEASSGMPGPVNSLMTQMGQVPPWIPPPSVEVDDSDNDSSDTLGG